MALRTKPLLLFLEYFSFELILKLFFTFSFPLSSKDNNNFRLGIVLNTNQYRKSELQPMVNFLSVNGISFTLKTQSDTVRNNAA